MDEEKLMLKLGAIVFIRDIAKFISVILIGYSTGFLLGACCLGTIYKTNVWKLIIAGTIGFILLIMYKILKNKCSYLCKKISDNK